jgi:hypothetical protein
MAFRKEPAEARMDARLEIKGFTGELVHTLKSTQRDTVIWDTYLLWLLFSRERHGFGPAVNQS